VDVRGDVLVTGIERGKESTEMTGTEGEGVAPLLMRGDVLLAPTEGRPKSVADNRARTQPPPDDLRKEDTKAVPPPYDAITTPPSPDANRKMTMVKKIVGISLMNRFATSLITKYI
jgi:hypothetical protein